MCSEPGITPSRARSSFERVSTRSAPAAWASKASRGSILASLPRAWARSWASVVRRLESVTVVAAIVARSAEDHLVRRHRVATSVRDALDRRLEAGVLERLDLPAVVADEVVVMIAPRVGRLEACDAVAEVDPLHEPERVHALECAVDARDSDAAAARAHFVVNLLRRQTAVLLAEELDDESPRAAAPAAGLPQPVECGGAPCHGDN